MGLNERFSELLKCKNISVKQAANIFGWSDGYIRKLMRKGESFGIDPVMVILNSMNDVSADWLLLGKGAMLKDSDADDVDIGCRAIPVPDGSMDGIPLIPLSAMAGAFTGESSVMEHECERYVIPAFKGADFLIQIKGDSMQPTYRSGDLVACQRVPLDDLFFQWNKIYVLDTVQGPLIKRIMPGSDADHITIVSDNASYPPFELVKSQFNGVALVRGLVRPE